MARTKTWVSGVLALLMLSQTGCIVSVLARQFLEDDEACPSQLWSVGEGSTHDSKSACEEQATETQTCVCTTDDEPEPQPVE